MSKTNHNNNVPYLPEVWAGSHLGRLASALAKDEQPILHDASHRENTPTEGAKERLVLLEQGTLGHSTRL